MIEQVNKVDIFATPIWISKLDNFESLKKSMIRFSETHRKENPEGAQKSNHAAYQSDDISWAQEIKPLYTHVLDKMVRQAIQDCELKVNSAGIPYAWVNFNDQLNSFNTPHIHYGIFSGIFYLNAPPGSGELVLMNTSVNELWEGHPFRDKSKPTRYNLPAHVICPEEGTIIMWCSHMHHYVKPNRQNVKRISISFNVHCKYIPEEEKND